MKNKIFKLMMDLQLFAEGDGTGDGDTGNGVMFGDNIEIRQQEVQ